MAYVLKFLIHRMRTIDGNKDSALGILDVLNKESVEEYMKENKVKSIKKNKECKIYQENEHKLYQKVYLKYQIMKIRAKISFMAFERN